MPTAGHLATTPRAVLADVGRTTIRLGLTADDGYLDHNSVREYDPQAQPTISSAIAAFGADCGLTRLPSRAAIAVSGVPRGETISITNSRWILSRSGLTSMFRAEPIIINDFAAVAWAISSRHFQGRIEALSGQLVQPHQPGTYCIIGIGSGLGVALLSRDESGSVTVVPTEAGHMGIMDGLPVAEPVLQLLRNGPTPVLAETLLSARGLTSIYEAVSRVRGRDLYFKSLDELFRPSAEQKDPAAKEALEVFAKALWYFAANMVLAYGAWDGLIFTGSITQQIRPMLERPECRRHFMVPGPYQRRLSQVPSATASVRHAELEGAAVALLGRSPAADNRMDSPLTALAMERHSDRSANAPRIIGASVPKWARRPGSC